MPVSEDRHLFRRQLAQTCDLALGRKKSASFDISGDAVYVDKVPMTASGKIQKVKFPEDTSARFTLQQT